MERCPWECLTHPCLCGYGHACVYLPCRGCEVLAGLSYWANGVELIVSAPAGCYRCSYHITLFLALSVPHWPRSCHYLPRHVRADMWEYICSCTFAAVSEWACLYVCLGLCFYASACVLPSCSHRASRSSCTALLHFCIIRSLHKVEREAGPSMQWIRTGE